MSCQACDGCEDAVPSILRSKWAEWVFTPQATHAGTCRMHENEKRRTKLEVCVQWGTEGALCTQSIGIYVTGLPELRDCGNAGGGNLISDFGFGFGSIFLAPHFLAHRFSLP